MRPDRIIVGEVRGKEALDMIQAMNTGHCGSLGTIHANSCKDALTRVETMVLMGMELPLQAIRSQVASGIDLVIHLGRLRDKTRKVLEIIEVLGFENGEIKVNTLFEFEEEGMENESVKGKLVKKNEITNKTKLLAAGY